MHPRGSVPEEIASLQQHMAELNTADNNTQFSTRLPESSLAAVQVPPPAGVSLGARVEHILVESDGSASEVLASALGAPLWFAEQLIDFGAVSHPKAFAVDEQQGLEQAWSRSCTRAGSSAESILVVIVIT
jgi:hypothetical protein